MQAGACSYANRISRYGDANVKLSPAISLLFLNMFHVFELHCSSPYELRHDKTNKMACAPSEDSDQPGHTVSGMESWSGILEWSGVKFWSDFATILQVWVRIFIRLDRFIFLGQPQ